LPQLFHTATFSPVDPLPRIIEDLACPACGHHDSDVRNWISDNTIRVFCDCCGAFVTIVLSDEQARAIHISSGTPSSISGRTSSDA
jgi:uncharacterized Zn finger protein